MPFYYGHEVGRYRSYIEGENGVPSAGSELKIIFKSTSAKTPLRFMCELLVKEPYNPNLEYLSVPSWLLSKWVLILSL